MSTYREFLLLTSSRTQDFTFDQALRWMDSYERYVLEKAALRPKKKRAGRLNATLAELQQPTPQKFQSHPFANLQPIFRNANIEAVLPCERDLSGTAGPFFASYKDSSFDLDAYAASAHTGWEKYRRLGALKKNEVFFSPYSPNQTDGKLQDDRAEFETQAVQITEIFTRMLSSEQREERTCALTFRRPAQSVRYSGDCVDAVDPRQFAPDATYVRNRQEISVFLPCAFWWRPVDEFRQFIAWIVEQCQSQHLCYELWQPGLMRDVQSPDD